MTPAPAPGKKNELTVVLSLPPKELSPNGRSHWARKAKAVAGYRRASWAVATEAMIQNHGVCLPKWRRATIAARYFFKAKRRRDQMNLIGSLKAAEDGLVDAGVLKDDNGVTWLPVTVAVDKARPRVELTITEETR